MPDRARLTNTPLSILDLAHLRQGGTAGFVAPQSKIHEGYSPSSSQNRHDLPGFAGCLAGHQNPGGILLPLFITAA